MHTKTYKCLKIKRMGLVVDSSTARDVGLDTSELAAVVGSGTRNNLPYLVLRAKREERRGEERRGEERRGEERRG